MNKQSDQKLINLLIAALILSLASILFISSKYLNLVDKQTLYLISNQSQDTRSIRTPQVATTPADISDWQKYQNEKYGFEIQFPKTWQGYSVTALDSINNFSVGFSFKDPHQPFTIFQIVRYTKDQWNALNKNSMTKIATKPDGSVLACDGCCSINSDFTGGQFDQFQIARCKEVPNILQSFKLTK